MGARNLSYRMKLPLYNMALGEADTLAVTPPFTFQGVTARVFPLRARMNILRNFCDRYLNVAREVCEFHPHLPYVFLVVLDYGRMAIEEFNMGWISQNEVFFGVPLAMSRRDRLGRPVFDKWVLNTPFIVVDDARSLTGGREAYGWPKVLGTLQSSPEHWLTDPRSPTRLLRLDIRGADSEEPGVRLLDIEQQSDQNASVIPPELEMMNPFGRLSRLARASMAIGSDLAQLVLAAPLFGFAPRNRAGRRRGDRLAALIDSLRRLSDFLDEPGQDVVTLKQFRDAEDPAQVCYQALVESRLSVGRYNRGGFLGLPNILRGDITGGFRIRLHDAPGFPIIDSLGLEVAQERRVRGNAVSFLEPLFPFWLNVDLNYGKGNTICWRTPRDPWHVKGNRVGRTPRKKVYYNTIAGGAEQVWHGPFYIPDAKFDVYPLPADPKRLRSLVERYLAADSRLNLEMGDADCVYMYVSANQIFSKMRSGAYIKAPEVSFHVPLHLTLRGRESGRIVWATLFAFVDNPILVSTMREVQGIPAMSASIEAPSRFLRREGPWLKMQADVFEALGAGQPSQRRTLIEIFPGTKSGSEETTEMNPDNFFLPRGRLTFKQLRDAEQPDRACYQSLVLELWQIYKYSEGDWQGGAIPVHIYQYPSLPLVETLGLIPTDTLKPREPGGAIAHLFTVEKSYRIEMSAEIGSWMEISRAAGSMSWQYLNIPDFTPISDERSRSGPGLAFTGMRP